LSRGKKRLHDLPGSRGRVLALGRRSERAKKLVLTSEARKDAPQTPPSSARLLTYNQCPSYLGNIQAPKSLLGQELPRKCIFMIAE
jgi:hypothetical protein